MNIPTEVGATEAEAIGKDSLPATLGPSSLAAPSLALLPLPCATLPLFTGSV